MGPFGYFSCEKCERIIVLPCGSADMLVECSCGNTVCVDRIATKKEIDLYGFAWTIPIAVKGRKRKKK